MKYFTKYRVFAISLVFSLLTSALAVGQERFNMRIATEGYESTLFQSLIEISDGYFVTGYVSDTVELPFGRPSVCWKFDLQGEVQFHKAYGGLELGQDAVLSSQNPDLHLLDDMTTIHSGVSFASSGQRQAYIMRHTLEGDTLSTIRIFSPNNDSEFDGITAISVVPSTDGNYFLLSNVVDEFTANDFIVQKLTPEGELLWTYEYATEQDPDVNHILLPDENGGVEIVPRYVMGTYPPIQYSVIHLDSEGNDNLVFETEFTYRISTTRSVLKDGDAYVCTAHKEVMGEDEAIPGVLKLDSDGEIIFHTAAWDIDEQIEDSGRKIQMATDGNYVDAGYRRQITEPTDSTGEYLDQAFLSKVNSQTGELMWTRFYEFLDVPFERQRLYDMRATSDGGFIFCGESTDLGGSEFSEPPYQQGWLVKVDEHGCLMEDCHINVNEREGLEVKFFQAGPNPSAEYLNIYQYASQSPSARYQLHNLQGKLIYEGAASRSENTTLMLYVADYPKGLYTLSLVDGGVILQSEKIVFE